MRLRYYLITAPLLLFTACSNHEALTGPTHENGLVELSAGIVESGSQMATRAGAEDNHTKHQIFASGTKLALRVSGTWTGHTPNPVVEAITATVGAETAAGSKHNALSCVPLLTWDDFGVGAEGNSDGRSEGLTIYGVAINGKTDAAPTVTAEQWTSGLPWTLAANQTTTDNTPADKDLLISNNVQAIYNQNPDQNDCGTYKFDSRGTEGKLLEFKHALSKITVNLKAGEGFNGAFTSTAVTLTSNKTGESNAEWAYTTGTVNITTGAVTNLSGVAAITMNAAATTDGYQATKEALVMPGSAFKKNAVILKINADGNIYYVTAEEIRAAINSTPHDTDDPTEAGKNYIINVVVNKTKVVVTATVTNWVTVNADAVPLAINVTGDIGAKGAATDKTFSLYRSTLKNNGYSSGLAVGSYYPAESTVSKSTEWTMTPTLYWPNHSTHYQFRGVYPTTDTGTGDVAYPRVEDGTGDTDGYQVIKVKNVAYTANSFPSDLMIGLPEVAVGTMCGSSEHNQVSVAEDGICPRLGNINLNFCYMMSQVEVNLTTSDAPALDRVDLTNAIVELVNVHKTGDVKLGTREVVPTGVASTPTPNPVTDTFGNYTLNAVAGDGNENKRLSAIVPQTLTYSDPQADSNVKFKITLTNGDVYYADVQPIKKEGSSDLVAPTAWESGKHYVYTLHLTKTAVSVTATLTDWTTVNASEDVWF